MRIFLSPFIDVDGSDYTEKKKGRQVLRSIRWKMEDEMRMEYESKFAGDVVKRKEWELKQDWLSVMFDAC